MVKTKKNKEKKAEDSKPLTVQYSQPDEVNGSSSGHTVAVEAKQLIRTIESLKIEESSQTVLKIDSTEAQNLLISAHGQEKSKAEIMAERKAKAAEAKARKAAAAKNKKERKADEEGVSQMKNDCVADSEDPELHKFPLKQGQRKSEKSDKSSATSSFSIVQPFKRVHFDMRSKEKLDGENLTQVLSISDSPTMNNVINVHRSFVEFYSRCEAKNIVGIDAICVAFIHAFKEFLSAYTIAPSQSMSRDLDQAIRPQLSYLTENGKHSFPLALGNLIRQLKKEINQMSDEISETEGKNQLYEWLDDFISQNFDLAPQAISSFCIDKLRNTPYVLTYSRCPVVEHIIMDAYNRGLRFHVCILDSPIEKRGFMIRECQVVLLGCSAILSNGFVVADRGAGQVALAASALNVPVLIAAQTCKFVDRVQSFSRGVHEVSALMNEHQEAVPADLITALVTELRIVPPSSAPAVLKAKQLVD